MYLSSFGKIYIITACHEDIYHCYCTQKGNNDHFHPYFDIIIFKETQSAMYLRWPGHYFGQFEKHLPLPKIKPTHRIHLEIRFNPA